MFVFEIKLFCLKSFCLKSFPIKSIALLIRKRAFESGVSTSE